MKILTTNFVKCAVKDCETSDDSFPLKYEDCELQLEEQEFQPAFMASMCERLDWPALVQVAHDLGNDALPQEKPANIEQNEQVLKELHSLLLETQIVEGKCVCRNCGHIYYVKGGIANFLLPPHLAK